MKLWHKTENGEWDISICVPLIKNAVVYKNSIAVLWEDGSQTVVTPEDGEEFDAEKGFAMAISKRYFENSYDKFLKSYEKFIENTDLKIY